MPTASTERLILGGGIAGLLAARRASEIGEQALLIADSIGGLIASRHVAGLQIDVGAEAFSIASPEVLQLLDELGLTQEIVEPLPEPARLISKQGVRRLPKGFFGIPADLNDPELLEHFDHAELAEARHRDSLPFGVYPTVEDLVVSRLGRPFLERLIEPVLFGVHGSSSDKLSAALVFPNLIDQARRTGSLTQAVSVLRQGDSTPGSRVRSIRGGMSRLVSGLVDSLAPSVSVQGGHVEGAKRIDNEWQVRAGATTYSAPHLTVALPSRVIASTFTEEPELVHAASAVSQVAVEVVVAHVRSAELNERPLGPGALVAADAGFRSKATTHVNAKWLWIDNELADNEHIIRLSVGRNGDLAAGSNLDWVQGEISSLYGCQVELIEAFAHRWPDALVQPNAKAVEDLKLAAGSLGEFGLDLASGFVSGNGILGIVKDHIKRKTK